MRSVYLHLLSYDPVLIVILKIRTVPEGIGQESSHLILIQIDLAFVIPGFIVIKVVAAAFTVYSFTHSIVSLPLSLFGSIR